MSPITEQLVVDFKELNLVGVKCGDCGTEIVLDVSEQGWRVPAKCPACPAEFDVPGLRNNLDAYRTLYAALQNSKHSVRVRICPRPLKAD